MDALRRVQADLIAAREQMGEAFFALDRHWRFTYLNREAERLLGRSREELLGKGIWEEYADAVGSEFHRQYTRVMQEGIPAAFEAYYPPLETWFEVHVHPEAAGLAVHFRAVNERKQAEALLQQSELKHRRLFETVPLGVVYHDREGRIISANPAAQRILGLSLEQLQGLTSLDPRWRAVREDGSDFPGEEHPAMVALRTGQPVRDTLMGVFHPGLGEYRWISVDATPLFEEGVSRPAQVYAVFRDVTEQRRAQQAVRESENRLRLILESVGEGVYGIDAEGRCTFINPAAARMLGYAPEEVLGQDMHRLVHHARPDGEPYPVEECPIHRALGSLQGCRVENEVFWRKDGTPVAVEYSAQPMIEQGQVRGAVISFVDVTERRRAETALRESEARFRTMADSAPVMIWVTEPDGSCSFLNQPWYDFTGQSPENGLGYGWLEAVHPDDRERSAQAFLEANARHEPFRLEYRLRRKDGEYRWAIDSARPRFGPGGEFLGYVGSVIDITERQQTEEALRESEARFRALSEHAPIGIYFSDPTGYNLYTNPQAQRIGGYTLEQGLGRGWVEFIHPEDRERVIAECGAATRAGQAYEIRYRWLRPDGTVRSSRVLGVPITGADGRVTGYVGTVEDTTERERAEEALRDSEERYRSLVEATAQIVWARDASGQFAAEQPGWAAFTGQSFEEYRGWGWLHAVHPDDRERVSQTWRECVREQRVYEIEYLLRRHDGEYRHMQVRAVPVRAPGGGVREWVGIHTDVTEEKRAERASAYLAAIVESSVDAVISKDLSGVITSWNKGAEAMYGYTAEEVVGKPVTVIIPPHLAAEEEEILARVRRGERVAEYETLRRRKDGFDLHVSLTVSPIRDRAGRVVGASSIARDITERKLEEERLRFLDDASVALASSLDVEETLRSIARLAVPRLADWCSVSLPGPDGKLEALEIAHTDPERVRLVRALSMEYPEDPTSSPQLLRSGRSLLVSEVTEEVLLASARDERHLELLRKLELGSALIVPMMVGGRAVGLIGLGMSRGKRRFDERDQALAEELGRRAAVALEHARLYRQLLEREAQFRSLADSLPQLSWMADAGGHVFWYNQRWYDYTGATPEEMEGWGWQAVHDPEVLPEVLQRWQAAVESGEPFEMVFPLRGHDGRYRSFLTRAVPLRDEKGRVVRWFGTSTDITRQIETEEALRQQLELNATITNNSTQALFMMDAQGYCTFMNPAAEKMLGFTFEEIRAKPLHDMIHHHHPDGRPYPKDECPIDRALPENFDIREHEDVFIRKNGEFFPVLVAASPIFDERGRPVSTVIEVRDVTERKQAEEALRASEQRYRSLVENYPGGAVILFDQELRYLLADGLGLADVGLSSEVLEGRTVYELFPPDLAGQLAALYRQALAGEHASTEVTFADRVYLLRVAPVPSPDGEVRQGLVFTQDITELKRLEAELRTLNAELEARVAQRTAELERSNRELEQFAYVASHDLQEPLRMISSYAQLLARRYRGRLDEKADQYIDFAVDGANRMQKLIQDLLAYSRVGTHGRALEPTDAGEVLRKTLEDLRLAIEESGATVEVGPLPTVLADRSQLTQVFQNLLVNALKFRHPERPLHLRVEAARHDGMWRFMVQDNGIGVESQYFERIFVIFQRLHGREDYPGSGIGLAVCKKIVERHGGKIWLESEPGEGSTFYFTWPGAEEGRGPVAGR
ncbi:Phytochrome-like protein cph1 [Calidithermus terrae]|uniref:histidine kinase n=1 Tax=Calidithermus terrae TaxID=1408545 RepID=A0A399EW34_9DEIN|nr:PAS domain S-box protein [Calidithermus terrae]RIH87845.1 Phytochrome-like protein cph1 [Calidithermus terrae]